MLKGNKKTKTSSFLKTQYATKHKDNHTEGRKADYKIINLKVDRIDKEKRSVDEKNLF